MELKYINPFIESVHDLFTNMLGCRVERLNPKVVSDGSVSHEIVGLIGLSGPTRGNVALLLPEATAKAMVGRLLGEEIHEIDDDVIDAVAELVNIIAGGAKARLSEGEPPIKLSLPNVIRGRDCTVHYPTKAVWLELPFTSELGEMILRLSFKFNGRDDA